MRLFLSSDNFNMVLSYTQEKVSNKSQNRRNMKWIICDIPLGYNIQRIRIEKGWTQEELVAKMQIHGSSMSRSTLANIEVGKRNIRASDLKIMKALFDTSYEIFFEC